ncbi:MAG: hypothetical protein DWI63_04455 [Chloroflexi bacterium]|nr:MAG: hypothetical protein DWI63_04455 [Chloroflexota bacterium]
MGSRLQTGASPPAAAILPAVSAAAATPSPAPTQLYAGFIPPDQPCPAILCKARLQFTTHVIPA